MKPQNKDLITKLDLGNRDMVEIEKFHGINHITFLKLFRFFGRGAAWTDDAIGLPAHFNMQRKAVKDFVEIAGFKIVALINEPTAATSLCEEWHICRKPEFIYIFAKIYCTITV